MTAALSHPPAKPAITSDSFDARCAQLRLFPFHCDAKGNVCQWPALPPALDRALRNGDFAALLASPQNLQVLPGCWAFPIPLHRGPLLTGTLYAVGFDTSFPHSPGFAEICSNADVPLHAAVADVAPFLRDFHHAADDLALSLPWMQADLALASRQRHTIDQFSGKLAQAYEEVNFLFRLARFLNHVDEPQQLIRMLIADIHSVLPFSWISVKFRNVSTVTPALSGCTLTHGSVPCDPALVDAATAEMLTTWNADSWTRILAPGVHPLATQLACEILAEPVVHDGDVIGILMAGNKSGDDPDLSSVEMQLCDAIAHFVGVFHENIARFADQRQLFLGTVHALTSAIDAKDAYTCGHSERVGILAAAMARALHLPDEQVELFRLAGMVHDVGKIGVPEAVLRKPGRLTEEEFAEIQKHPRIGHTILHGIPQMAGVLPAVLYHHERWDGNGYPDRLVGEQIPLIARVLGLADTFDAMSSHRAYRAARPRETVLAELLRCAGSQFDPALAPLFATLDFTDFDAALSHHSPAQP